MCRAGAASMMHMLIQPQQAFSPSMRGMTHLVQLKAVNCTGMQLPPNPIS